MKTRKVYSWLLVAALFCGLSSPPTVQGGQPVSSADASVASSELPQERTIGAPQVLEIPPIQEENLPVESTLPPPAPLPAYESTLGRGDLSEDGSRTEAPVLRTTSRRNYLGVLYATAEDGPVGVKVLDVVPGSPAERAGFQGANRPPEQHSDLMKAAIVVLAMSPAGPFAIPLAIAHDLYMNHQSPGDVIVAVGDRPVHNAQEFSEEMRRYQPRDTVSFSVMRAGKPLQITVQLEEEPT